MERICGNVSSEVATAIRLEAARRRMTIGELLEEAFAARIFLVNHPSDNKDGR